MCVENEVSELLKRIKYLEANQIPENHFVMHEDDLYALYKFTADHNFKGISVDGCAKIANQCVDRIIENLDNVAERLGHPKFNEWKEGIKCQN